MTIVDELIKANPQMHEELCSKQMMVTAIKTFAIRFRDRHLELAKKMDSQAAFEIALSETEGLLSPSEFDLDEAMSYLCSHSPSA